MAELGDVHRTGVRGESVAGAPAAPADLLSGPDWYRHAVFYELSVRSFQDSDGDGIGDFPGLTSRLGYLKELGVGAVWLMPMMPSPFKDSGYDVADYLAVDPDYGTLEEFDTFLAAAHALGIRVFIDLVLNHTSDQHAWFQESRSSRTNPKADWYIWSDTPSSPDFDCGIFAGFLLVLQLLVNGDEDVERGLRQSE
jgi:1,4-alpha-glucan branching enzyme